MTDPISEAQMHDIARKLGDHLQAGDTLLLNGDLGAGKSSFARALIRHLIGDTDSRASIPSPTFTLVQTYQAPEFEIFHADLYRLGDMSELFELGLFDNAIPSVSVIEWPDRLGSAIPTDALWIDFEIGDDFRRLHFKATGPRWKATLNDIL